MIKKKNANNINKTHTPTYIHKWHATSISNLFSPHTTQAKPPTKINNKKLQLNTIITYLDPNHLLFLRCGDIETNPKPILNLLHKHLTTHKGGKQHTS